MKIMTPAAGSQKRGALALPNYAVALVIGALAILSAVFLAKDTDFKVYWYGIRFFLDGTQPLYGPKSGIRYPQEFRYPPVTVLFFLPFTYLSLRAASMCWIVGAWAACAYVTKLAIRTWRLTFSAGGILFGLVLLVPYIVLAVKFGNVQPYLVALVFAAMLWADEHPERAGIALAVAICFKVWPLVFVPWLLRRPRTLYAAGIATAVLWMLPVWFFGWHYYLFLLQDFYTHAAALASGPEAVWYSSQSLRGVLLRLLTNTVPPRDGYPDLSFATLPPGLIAGCYVLIAAIIYGYSLFQMWRSSPYRRFEWEALAFVLFSALQPFCLNSSLISLLPAILMGAHIYSSPGQYPPSSRRWFLVACGLSIVATLTPIRHLQRDLVMLGTYLWIMLALGISLMIAALSKERPASEN